MAEKAAHAQVDIGGNKEEAPIVKEANPLVEGKATGDTPPLQDDGVPDPDEDDLDDLDDLLDDFAAVKVEPGPTTAPEPRPTSGPRGPSTATEVQSVAENVLSDDEFAKQLQDGMADLLGEIENSPEVQAQFENIFRELGAAAASSPTPPSGAGAGPSTRAPQDTAAEESFQETIRRTMERMQSSGEQATAAAAAEGSDDFMAELMKQMQAGGGLPGEGNEEELSKMLLGMMEQLTNKEILYEPMKELSTRFPPWLQQNRATTSAEDLKRYEEQESLVQEIVAKFEEPAYSDANAADREYIVDRMQKMQAAGEPPAELVGDMPSAQDALSAPDGESCNPQ